MKQGAAKEPRVLHLLNHWPGGGVEFVIETIIDGLVPKQFSMRVLTLNDVIRPSSALERNGVPIRAIASPAWPRLKSLLRSPAQLFGKPELRPFLEGVDLIHAHHPLSWTVARRLAKYIGKPYILTMHNQDEPWSYSQAIGLTLFRSHLQRAMRDCARILCVGRPGLTQLRERLGWNLPQAEVLENCTSQEVFDLAAQPPAAKRYDAAMLCRFVPEKNVPFAARCFVEAAKKRPDFRAVIVGDGPERVEVERIVAAAGAEGAVELRGWLTRPEALTALRESRVLFQPSLGEGLPITGIDALALGLRAVLSDIPAHTAAFEGYPGVWFERTDDVEGNTAALLEACDGDEPIFREGFEERFGPASYMDRLAAIYRETAAK